VRGHSRAHTTLAHDRLCTLRYVRESHHGASWALVALCGDVDAIDTGDRSLERIVRGSRYSGNLRR